MSPGLVPILGNWKEVLLKVVDKDQLPAYWGGEAVDADGDAHCGSHVSQVTNIAGTWGGRILSQFVAKLYKCPRTPIAGIVTFINVMIRTTGRVLIMV